MRPPHAMMALAGSLAASIALAQVPAPAPTGRTGGLRQVANVPAMSPTGTAPGDNTAGNGIDPIRASAPKDNRVYEASTSLPTPTPPDQIPAPTIALPTDPIEPYLLTRSAGPFMVMAKTFRGPDAERWALALVLELRNSYGLPAYVLRTRDFPMRSNIRDVPPTALRQQQQPHVTDPEKTRTYDEAAVLVGDEKTLHGSEVLLHKVEKIKPKCLNGMPSIFKWRVGLTTAMRTTNPFVPAQDLYPQKADPFVKKLNGGSHSLLACPGHYTLQVAEFSGRATFNPENPEFKESLLNFKSPLGMAYDNAESLADALARDPEIKKTGAQPYVFHDRTSSKVMLGAFNAPDDPAAARLRATMLKIAVPLTQKTKSTIVPAPMLTDVEVLRASAQ
jgi:hypothetical protein